MKSQRTWWAHALFVAVALGAAACGGSTASKPPVPTPGESEPATTERFSADELAMMEPVGDYEGLYSLNWEGPWTYTASGRTFAVQSANLSRRMILATDTPTQDVSVQYGRPGCRVTLYDFLPSDGLRPTELVLLAEAERALNEMRVAIDLHNWLEPQMQSIDGISLSYTGGSSVHSGVQHREAAMLIADERWLYKVRVTAEESVSELCLVDALVLLFEHAEAIPE